MTFNPNVPAAGDFLSQSQSDLLNNFNVVSYVFEENHIPLDFGMNEDRGKHPFISFTEQSSDPATTGDTYAIYTKNDSGTPEIFGRPESSGTVYKWTKLGRLAPSLKLEAAVIFDIDGNIIKNSQNQELKFNVDEIQLPNPLVNGKNVRDDWIVKFENAISTDKYFWVISAFYGTPPSFNPDASLFTSTVPYMFGSYSDAVKTTQIRIMTKNINGLSTATQRLTFLVHLQIYTVA